jgi:hypothetical protein
MLSEGSRKLSSDALKIRRDTGRRLKLRSQRPDRALAALCPGCAFPFDDLPAVPPQSAHTLSAIRVVSPSRVPAIAEARRFS